MQEKKVLTKPVELLTILLGRLKSRKQQQLVALEIKSLRIGATHG